MAIKTLGKLGADTSGSKTFAFYGFRGGLNVKAAPQLVGDDDLTIATNGYLRPDGAFQMRNGMLAYGTALGAYPLYLKRFFQLVVNGASITEVSTLLGIANGALYSIASGGNTSIGTVGGVNALPPTWVRFEDPNDAHFTSGLTDVIVICTGYLGPYVWDGTNLYTPGGWGAASGARWCAIVNGIVWFGGIPAFPNQVFGTGDGIIASMESLPAYRNFVFSQPVVGLCAQGTGATATLVVALNTGFSVLYGTGPSTFFLQDIPWSDGVVSGRAMSSYAGVVFLLGHWAEYSFDGQTVPLPVSKKVEPWILNDPFTAGYPMTQNQNLAWSAVYNNRLHIGYCSDAPTLNTILCYDLDLGSWTVLVTNPGLASMTLFDAPGDPDPYTCYAGSSTTGQVYQWDYVSSTISNTALDGATPVLAQVQSKYFKLGLPGTNKMVTRFYPEFLITGNFSTTFTLSSDYGSNASNTQTQSALPITNAFQLDVSELGMAVLGGTFGFTPFGSPASRLDFSGLQGDSFAFGISTSTPLAPWVWSGGSGVFSQQGKT